MLEALGWLLFVMSVLAWYMIPAIIAFARKHPNAVAILVLDLVVGWTFIGWVVALVWCFTGRPANPPTRRSAWVGPNQVRWQ